MAEELAHAQVFAKRIQELYGTVPGSKGFCAIQRTDGVDPVTQDMITTILADEQKHLRTFEGFLREFEQDG